MTDDEDDSLVGSILAGFRRMDGVTSLQVIFVDAVSKYEPGCKNDQQDIAVLMLDRLILHAHRQEFAVCSNIVVPAWQAQVWQSVGKLHSDHVRLYRNDSCTDHDGELSMSNENESRIDGLRDPVFIAIYRPEDSCPQRVLNPPVKRKPMRMSPL